MDQKFYKKIGEVLAFEKQTTELFQKGREGFLSVFPEEYLNEVLSSSQERVGKIEAWVNNQGVNEIVFKKAEATGSKLASMRDMYVAERWDDGVELMEWLGFFEGAAIVHWDLVKGGGNNFGQKDIVDVAVQALTSHTSLFEKVRAIMSSLLK